VDIARARELLADLEPDQADFGSEVGLRNHEAYLRIHDLAKPERWAVVYTSGATYTSLEIDGKPLGTVGRFSLDCFHEGVPDTEVEGRLREYADVAVEYLRNGGTVERSRRLRIPRLIIGTIDAQHSLSMSVVNDLRDLLRPAHW
jgi:hypothetical protein